MNRRVAMPPHAPPTQLKSASKHTKSNYLSNSQCDTYNSLYITRTLMLLLSFSCTVFALIHLTKWHTVEMVFVLTSANLVLTLLFFLFVRLLIHRLFLTPIILFILLFCMNNSEQALKKR